MYIFSWVKVYERGKRQQVFLTYTIFFQYCEGIWKMQLKVLISCL